MNLLVRNVIEREIEREKVQMKPPKVGQNYDNDEWPIIAFCFSHSLLLALSTCYALFSLAFALFYSTDKLRIHSG